MNLFSGEALQVFKQKYQENGNKTNMNYKFVMQGGTNNLFPTKALLHQKRYLHWGLFVPQESKMCKFIFHLKNIVQYLERFPTFWTNQGIPDNEIIKLIKFALYCKWQIQLLIQGFNYATKILNMIINDARNLK